LVSQFFDIDAINDLVLEDIFNIGLNKERLNAEGG